MRHSSLYRAPFRIRERGAAESPLDLGETLTAANVTAAGGPLFAQGPGDLTRWMAVPWQGDTLFCRSGYEPEFDPYIPSFWPARVPNQVLLEEDYRIVMDTSQPRENRRQAFQRRASWVRGMHGTAAQQILQMVAAFGQIGVVEARPGIKGDPDFPEVMFVEALPRSRLGPLGESFGTRAAPPVAKGRGAQDTPVQRAGWESAEQLAEFRRLRLRR